MAKPPPFPLWLALVISFGLYTGSYVLDQAFRWTDTREGIICGLVFVPIMGIIWLLMGLLPGLLIYGLFRWRKWERFRTAVVAAPGMLALATTVAELFVSPPTAPVRFKRFMGVDLPASASEIEAEFSGGGFGGYYDTYTFRCRAEDTDWLIQVLGLEPIPDEAKKREGLQSYQGGSKNGACSSTCARTRRSSTYIS